MNSFTGLFLAVLAFGTALQYWLIVRQRVHVMQHRARVPAPFTDAITLDAHQKAADYTHARGAIDQADLVLSAVLLLGWTVGGGLQALDNALRMLDLGPVATGTAVLVAAFLLMALLDLPVAAYRTFVIEQRFGFNRTTVPLFIVDTLKKGLLLIVFGAPLAAVVVWLMSTWPQAWWFYTWLVWMAFMVLMIWLYPTVIAPLFNRFVPLEDAALKQQIQQLLDRTGFRSRGIYVMDGSRRSGHGNAYFTGFGNNKRIVFFDTLAQRLAAGELIAVLAHELGHFRRGHVRKRLLVTSAMSLAGLALLGWLAGQPWFYSGLGVTTPSPHVALLLFMLVTPVFTTFLQPLLSWWSRRHEYEADNFAASQASADDLIQALVKLYRDNAATVTPDPWYSAFHDSHPPAALRIANLSHT